MPWRAGARRLRELVRCQAWAGVRLLDDKPAIHPIQAHGALGLTDELPLAFWWRHERAARIYDGADDVHKTAVARRILAGYGMRGKTRERPPAAG